VLSLQAAGQGNKQRHVDSDSQKVKTAARQVFADQRLEPEPVRRRFQHKYLGERGYAFAKIFCRSRNSQLDVLPQVTLGHFGTKSDVLQQRLC
jgi:hypothetical protein